MSTDPESNQRTQKAKSYFDYGNDAALKSNFDYAIDMYTNACKLVPDNLLYRQALRGIVRRKFGNDPSKVGRMVGARVQPLRLKARAARSRKHWGDVLQACEEALAYNPWDVGSTRDAAEAAEQLGIPKLAQWLVESVESTAEDADFYRYSARVHESQKDWAKAIRCWERVKKLDPNDEVANRQVNALSASATIQRSGLAESVAQRNAAAAAGPEVDVPNLDELKKQRQTPEERLLSEIRDDPSRVGPYLQLAEMYRGRGQLDEAEQVLGRGVKAVPGDNLVLAAHAEVQLARLRRAVDGWSKRLAKAPDDAGARAKFEHLTGVLNEYERKELRRRIALRPDDMKLVLELGLALARAGKHDEAIASFQQARATPALKVQALLQAGLSFEATGVPKLAERSYQDAIRVADADDTATLNQLHYRLGRVAEANGQLQAAEDHYNEVAANDYSYMDVAARLRALNQKPAT